MNEALINRHTIDGANYERVAGTATDHSDWIDMAKDESIVAILAVGAITATGTVAFSAEDSNDAGATDPASDLAGSGQTILAAGNSQTMIVLEVYRPLKRYIRFKTVRATANAVLDALLVVKHGRRLQPTAAQGAKVSASKYIISPDEGAP